VSNPLPVTLVQAAPRPLAVFASDVEALGRTGLVAFPELHLCGVNRTVEQLRDVAEPLHRQRVRARRQR